MEAQCSATYKYLVMILMQLTCCVLGIYVTFLLKTDMGVEEGLVIFGLT